MNHGIFVNRILNMKKIKYIGIDMDHTLIRYHTQNFENLVYQLVIDYLIQEKHYPQYVSESKFHFTDAIRGLVIDSKNGNILKLSRYGAIRQSHHGTKLISFDEQKNFYRSIYVDLNDPNYMAIDTSFSIAFCVLYAQLVDLRDGNPNDFPSYNVIAQDVLQAVDIVHAAGKLKRLICESPENFIILDPQLVPGIKRYLKHGKKFFILTNSEYTYANYLLNYAFGPYLGKDEKWWDLFEFVITLANKPKFFYDVARFLHIDPSTGAMTNCNSKITPGIYQGGYAKKFTEDLGLLGDDILYIGDHIYGDILRLKKDCNWRTALVVEELQSEILAQIESQPIEEQIVSAMLTKQALEEEYVDYHTKSIEEHTSKYNNQSEDIHQKIHEIDERIFQLLKQQKAYFNAKWGRVFRAGAEESYFAHQMERYACIYMQKLSDLLAYSPLTYFRAHRRLLPHDLEIA